MKENLSIVIPIYNERDNIIPLYERITSVMRDWRDIESYEVILIDDFSTDGSLERCESIRDPHVRLVRFKKHLGQTLAIKAGIDAVRYELVATLDADLQNDPADLPVLLDYLRRGFDFVQGRREKREDPWVRKVSSRVANAVRRSILGDSFHDMGCSLRLFRKKCLAGIDLFDGAHRFLPFLVQRNGFRVVECGVHHHPRAAGVSKYNIHNRLFKAFGDLIRVRLHGKKNRATT